MKLWSYRKSCRLQQEQLWKICSKVKFVLAARMVRRILGVKLQWKILPSKLCSDQCSKTNVCMGIWMRFHTLRDVSESRYELEFSVLTAVYAFS